MEPYLYFHNDRPVEQPTARTEGSNAPRGVFWRAGARAPGFELPEVLPTITRRAVDTIRERAKHPGQPFFLYLALTAPHTPWLPLPEFRGKSKAGDYGDFVAQVDDTVGQVMRALDQTGLADNTLLIVTSDNGADWKVEDKERFAHRANADWRGEKADIWDGGHRIPFLARWRGHIAPGSTSAELGCLIDLMGTVAEVVDYRLPGKRRRGYLQPAARDVGQEGQADSRGGGAPFEPGRLCDPAGRLEAGVRAGVRRIQRSEA